jgi:hypothetical protein
MGQVIGTLGVSNCLLGSLYRKRTASINEMVAHFLTSNNRRYYKSAGDEEDDGWPANTHFFELFLLYNNPKNLFLGPEHAKPSRDLMRFYKKLITSDFSPIISAASFPSSEHELCWSDLHSETGRDGWSNKQYEIFQSIPLCFEPGWRQLIKIIPRVSPWRPDEWWLSDKTGN